MCKKVNNKNCPNVRIDKCLKGILQLIDYDKYSILASCCGHGRYPTTIVGFVWKEKPFPRMQELISGIPIPRSRNFYRKDSKGYYYIPEVCEGKR